MIDYKSYRYALLANSRWMILYRTKEESLKVYSEETGRDDAVPMDEFNEIGDYFMNSGYDYYSEREVLHAIENDLNWVEN